MKKDPQLIAQEIINLVSELSALAGVPLSGSLSQPTKASAVSKKSTSGATGGIRLLVEGGKLDSPKSSAEVIELLKREGRHYPSKTVLMGLLSLVRERTLTRLKENGEKTWKYVNRR